MSPPSLTPRRWYDHRDDMSRSVDLLVQLPFEILNILAEGVVVVAENQLQTSEIIQSYRSLGPEKVLALYKSKHRRRQYDHAPAMHKLMNYMTILSEENQQFVSAEIHSLVSLLFKYLLSCRQARFTPRREDVNRITACYVQHGKEETEKLIQTIHATLMERVRRFSQAAGERAPVPEKSGRKQTNIVFDAKEARLKQGF